MGMKRPVHLLLAEDEPDHQDLLVRAVRSAAPDVRISVVSRGRELLAALANYQYDCVVMDFMLPDTSAAALLQSAEPLRNGCPFIIVSSRDDQRIAIESFRAGIVDFIPKQEAVAGDTLWHCIEGAIQAARQRRANRRRAERRERFLVRLAETDSLTGLGNRRHLERCLSEQRWETDRRGWIACIMVDLDHFKQVNDRYGHDVGDRLLRTVSTAIRQSVGLSDTVVRWGGEEFLVVADAPTLTEAWGVGDAIRRSIAQIQMEVCGQALRPTASVGVAHVRTNRFHHTTIARADEALYLAKSIGRNRVCHAQMVEISNAATRAGANMQWDVCRRRDALVCDIIQTMSNDQWSQIVLHGERVRHIALELADRLDFDPADRSRLEAAALIRAVGKAMIPDCMLVKPSGLSPVERSIKRDISGFAAHLAERLGADSLTTQWAGTTSATFVDGECQINDTLLGGQIVLYAERLAAMVADRPHRAALSLDAAIRELRRECHDLPPSSVIELITASFLPRRNLAA